MDSVYICICYIYHMYTHCNHFLKLKTRIREWHGNDLFFSTTFHKVSAGNDGMNRVVPVAQTGE